MSKRPNDLKWVVDSGTDEIDYYLENVTTAQFAEDVKNLITRLTDKELVRNMINALKELL